MSTPPTRAIIAAGLLLFLPACGIRTWVDVSIAADSTGTVSLHVATDQELRDGLATFSPDADPSEQLTTSLGEQGWAIEPAPVDGEWEGVVARHDFANIPELEGLMGQALQGDGSNLEILETESGLTLAASLGPPASGTDQADLLADAAEVVDLDGRLRIEFPDVVTATNGTISEDGRAVTWTYNEQNIAGLEITAETKKSSRIGFLAVAAGSILVVGAVAIVVVGRRRTKIQPQLEVEV